MKSKYIEDKPFLRITQTVYTGLMLNIAFTIVAAPFFLSLLIFGWQLRFSGILWLTAVSLGPALYGLYACYDEIYEHEAVHVFSTFWQALRKHWRQLLLSSSACVLLLFFYSCNFSLFKDSEWAYVNVIFTFGMIFTMGMFSSFSYFLARNPQQAVKNIVMTAFYCFFKKWPRILLNCLLLSILAGIMFVWPPIGFIFAPSIVVSVLYLNSRHLLGQ